MSKALTTNPRETGLRPCIQSRQLLLSLICCIIAAFCPGQLKAEIFRPLQIFLPGNLGGKLVALSDGLEATPSAGWRIPDTLEAFRRDRSKSTVTFAPGNDSDAFSGLSFLTSGDFERQLIDRCRPDAAGISPSDLEVFNSGRLNQQIRQRILTNAEAAEGRGAVFPPFRVLKVDARNIWFFNHIDPDFCRDLPVQNWGQFSFDNPARSIRRLNPAFSPADLSISTVYAGKAVIAELVRELKARPGHHLVVQIPDRHQSELFSTINPERDDNVFMMSVKPGHVYLPLINLYMRNSGYPRLTLRMIPLEKSRSANAGSYFAAAWQEVKKLVFLPLRVIKTTSRPSTAPSRLSGAAHAHMLRTATGADIAFLTVPETKHFTDNVIFAGNIVSCMSNDRIRKFRLNGQEFARLAEALLKDHGIRETAFSGCDFSYLAGHIENLRISGQPMEREKTYLAVTTGLTMTDSIVDEFLSNRVIENFDGQMLWNVWKNNLKTLRISDENLFE